MKKIFAFIAISMLGFVASSYANGNDGFVPAGVTTEFSQQFVQAKDVKWVTGNGFYKATFEDWGRTLFAYYSGDGDLIGVSTNLTPAGLPERLKTQITKSYANYWITDLFGFHNQDEHGFVITLENPDKVVVLKAAVNGGWAVYKTMVKS
jgi:hypothetical protein